MSFAHVLELGTQSELLDRLGLLTRFGSNLIVINGADGYGKSWLAQRYLELGARDKNQCLLLCRAHQDEAQYRTLILSQLISDALFNQHEPLIDSLEQLLGNEPCDIAIVVDDAHLLSDTLVSELWMLVLEAQQKLHWTINVLLFAQSGRLEPVLSRVSYGLELKPIELDIEMLSEVEARHFFESLVARYVDDDAEKQVRAAFKTVDPIPGEIMALGEMKVEKRIIIRSIVGSSLNITLVVLVLLLLAVGGYWWMFTQPSPDDQAQRMAKNIEQTAIPTLRDPNTVDAEPNLVSVTDGAPRNADELGATDDSNSLPPAVTHEVASVGRDNKQQRVVIESDVVDALLEGKPERVNTDQIKAVAAAIAPQVSIETKNSDPVSTKVEPSDMPVQEVVEVETVSSKPVIKFSFAREELKALSPRAYTLQLAAMISMEEVQAFLDEYQLNNQVRIYPTIRDDTEWYIVTYQDYPTIQLARDAVNTLPDALKSVNPWAKSLRQVHREIDRMK